MSYVSLLFFGLFKYNSMIVEGSSDFLLSSTRALSVGVTYFTFVNISI